MAQKLYEEINIQAIANAIRAKNGLTTTYKTSEMAGAIEAIQTCSGTTPTEPVLSSEITFYDYDGTILYAFTREQAQALTALPDAPAHNGLIFDGWTHTLEQVKATKTVLKVGATYKTDDGTTRIHIHLEDGRTSPCLTLKMLLDNTATIDWGDGTTVDTLTGRGTTTGDTSLEHKYHNYAVAGDYVIKLTGGTIAGSGSNNNDTHSYLLRYMPVLANADTRDRVYQRTIKKVEMGTHTSLDDYGFAICDNINSVVIPNPNNNSSIYPYVFEKSTHLNTIVLPNKITSINENAFYQCYTLTNIIMSGVISIGARAFFNCYALPNVVFPSTIHSIGNYAFYGCGGVKYYDFTACSSVPTLGGTNAFNGMPADCEIRVPASLETTWKNATNWTTYADYIVGV